MPSPRMYYKAASERDVLIEEAGHLRRALEEIALCTAAYRDDTDWPLVSGVHSVARLALERIATTPVVELLNARSSS